MDRQTEIDRHTDKTKTCRHGEVYRQTDKKQTERTQTGRHTDKQTNRKADIQTDRPI